MTYPRLAFGWERPGYGLAVGVACSNEKQVLAEQFWCRQPGGGVYNVATTRNTAHRDGRLKRYMASASPSAKAASIEPPPLGWKASIQASTRLKSDVQPTVCTISWLLHPARVRYTTSAHSARC